MLTAAAWEHDLDLNQSFMIGDKATDIDMAHNAGCVGILVQTGFGDRVLSGDYQHHTQPEQIVSDLAAAVEWLLCHPRYLERQAHLSFNLHNPGIKIKIPVSPISNFLDGITQFVGTGLSGHFLYIEAIETH
jgi:hypothetical protein